jgi:putative phosphoesterase
MISVTRRYRARVFVSGHTHLPILEKVEGIVLLNPGSAAIPKFEKDGKPVPSAAIIEDDNIRIVSLDNGETLFELPDWRE